MFDTSTAVAIARVLVELGLGRACKSRARQMRVRASGRPIKSSQVKFTAAVTLSVTRLLPTIILTVMLAMKQPAPRATNVWRKNEILR